MITMSSFVRGTETACFIVSFQFWSSVEGSTFFEINADQKVNVLSIRGIIADFFTQNNNDISFGDDDEFHFVCESIESIRSGKGGRQAYGGVSEIVA